MSSKPSQTRTIDPFAEYNSNVANRLSRMLTQNNNGLYSTNSLRLTYDSTSPTTAVVVQTGMVFKDDVLIEITEDHIVDFEDADHYINASGGGGGELGETGYYYVCLEYTYVKSRPAPDVDIKILKPSQRGQLLTADSLLLLGVVEVAVSGISNKIVTVDPFTDYDPSPGYTDNKREYIPFPFAGSETGLPAHDTFRDQSSIRYDALTDKFWLGYKDRWEQINAASLINIDTTGSGLAVGDLCYVDASGNAQKSILSTVDKRAEFVVLETGLESDGTGQGRTYGVVSDVPVASGAVSMSVGDVCYLDSTEAGKVTNVKQTGAYQNVGKCIAVNGSTIDMLFIPGDFLNQAQSYDSIINTGDWTPVGDGLNEYVDITHGLGKQYVNVTVVDDADDYKIEPVETIFTDENTLTIWMPLSTGAALNVAIVG